MKLLRYQTPAYTGFDGLDELFARSFPILSRMNGRFDAPRERAAGADLYETPEGYAVRLEMPGMNKDSIDVQVEGNQLTIKVSSESGSQEKGDRQVNRYERSLTIPRGVNPESITASSENGILTVILPKAPEEQPRRIEVS